MSDLTNRERESVCADNDVRAAAGETSDDPKLQLLAEDVSVAKETRETGRVRVTTHTREREALVDQDLTRERVEVETIPMGLRIDAMPEVRHEGDVTIVPVVEEVLVVERQLILKEEVHLRRVRTSEHHREKVTLRYQEAVVTHTHTPAENADPTSVNAEAKQTSEME